MEARNGVFVELGGRGDREVIIRRGAVELRGILRSSSKSQYGEWGTIVYWHDEAVELRDALNRYLGEYAPEPKPVVDPAEIKIAAPPMKPVYLGACCYCDFQHEADTPVECNMAVIRHKCERKYPGLDPLAEGYTEQLRARGIPASDAERDLAVEHARPAERVPGHAGRLRRVRDDFARLRLRRRDR